jgi:hypothetical protein
MRFGTIGHLARRPTLPARVRQALDRAATVTTIGSIAGGPVLELASRRLRRPGRAANGGGSPASSSPALRLRC